jgi:hypothetical protein
MAAVTLLGRSLSIDLGVSCVNPFWALAELNGDGRLDLVVATASVFVFRSATTQDTTTSIQALLDLPSEFIDGSVAIFGAQAPRVILPTGMEVDNFLGDGQPGVFISDSGLDAPPWPGAFQHLLLPNGEHFSDISLTLPMRPKERFTLTVQP